MAGQTKLRKGSAGPRIGSEIVDLEPDHLATCFARRNTEQELDAVPVGEDRVGANVALSSEVNLEEAVEQGRQSRLGATAQPFAVETAKFAFRQPKRYRRRSFGP